MDTIKQEFVRILKPNGSALLIWNIMRLDTPFMQAYKAFRKEYEDKVERPLYADYAAISEYFSPLTCKEVIIPHSYALDWQGLQGLLLSSSLVPSDNAEMLSGLKKLFDTYAVDGKVEMRYNAKVYHMAY